MQRKEAEKLERDAEQNRRVATDEVEERRAQFRKAMAEQQREERLNMQRGYSAGP